MARAAVPKSTAKNAYELFEDVCKVILEEPKRYNQSTWVEQLRVHADVDRKEEFAACGTMACIAGWMAILKRGRTVFRNNVEIADKAHRLVNPSYDAPFEVVRGLDDLFNGGLIDPDIDPGTKRYAQAGVREIKRFMKKHRKYLLSVTYTSLSSRGQ